MPGRKRTRSPSDDRIIEDVEVEPAQSNLQRTTSKKVRLSADPEDVLDSDVSTDEELDSLQATQFWERQRKKIHERNTPADNGIIESVTCTNFMCHSFLDVSVGPLINFIIGHNGSGKSAVLTAITICLGGKASNTNRAGNLKAFIKEGQDACVLSVKLKNTTDTGYQTDVYGDSIIVERHFNKAGTSGFKLKSSNGRIISTRRVDLEDICDYFALQLDNPMSVLSQDNARQFLSNSSPEAKYKFFIKGVQLEQLNQDYQLMEENIDSIEATFTDKRRDVDDLSQKATIAKELFAMSERHDNLRRKLRKIGVQMAWAQVEEQERYLLSFDDDIVKAEQKIVEADGKVTETSETFKRLQEAYDLADNAVRDTETELEPVNSEKVNAKAAFDSVKAEAQEAQRQQRKIKENLREEAARIERLRNDITNEERRLEEVSGGSHARRLAELEESKRTAAIAKINLDEHNRTLQVLEDVRSKAQATLEEAKAPRRGKELEIQQCNEQLKAMRSDRGQQRNGYPANMVQLIRAVKQDDGFLDRPIGPLGDSIRLVKPVWSSILEKSFGTALNSFVVTSKQDQARLSATMQRVNCLCPIQIGNKNMFDYSNNEPDPELLTTLRALEIDNPLVTRQLIINQGIEQTILIEDMSEATDLMDRTRLRNVKQCFSTNNKARAGAGVRLNYGYQGTLSITYVEPYHGPPRMRTDVESQIRFQQETLQRLERELNEVDQQYREIQKAVDESNKAIGRHQKTANELRLQVRIAQSAVDKLQDALDGDAVEEGRLEALKQELEDAERDKAIAENTYQESVLEKDKYYASMKEHSEQMSAIDERVAAAEQKKEKAKKRCDVLSNQRATALLDKNRALEVLQASKDGKEDLRDQRAEKSDLVEDFTQKASQVGARIPIDEGDNPKTLGKRFERLHSDLEKYEKKLGGDKRKIAEDYAKATQAYNDALLQFQEEEKLAQLLKMTLIHRKWRWMQFKRRITARARFMFGYLLAERGFRGKLTVDHAGRALDLNVQPDETQSDRGRQSKTLSGGEKSFSTICLLLSLWEAMGAPIRCLDEFDVFMDSVNRDVSMKMIIQAARRSTSRQFILITPQSMSAIDREEDVKIIKMQDPERNQTTLPFARP